MPKEGSAQVRARSLLMRFVCFVDESGYGVYWLWQFHFFAHGGVAALAGAPAPTG